MHLFLEKIKKNINKTNRCLCLGLDPDINKIPTHFEKNIIGIEKFLFEIIETTSNEVAAYKPNVAFFEALGTDGISLLKKIQKFIPNDVPSILDAKRADIGNTSEKLASYIFDYLEADATTLHPYMGEDSLTPFFNRRDKFNFVLCLTSNPSASDFEKLTLASNEKMYEFVAKKSSIWLEKHKNVGIVVGATHLTELKEIRVNNPNLLFLVPGVGAQGGDFKDTQKHSLNNDKLTLINMTRNILFADNSKNYRDIVLNKIKELPKL